MIVVKQETFLRRRYSVVCKNTSWKGVGGKTSKLSCKVAEKRVMLLEIDASSPFWWQVDVYMQNRGKPLDSH